MTGELTDEELTAVLVRAGHSNAGCHRILDVVFDGPPGPEAGRFVEVEDEREHGVSVGQWVDRGNGLWALRIIVAANSTEIQSMVSEIRRLRAEVAELRAENKDLRISAEILENLPETDLRISILLPKEAPDA